MTVTGYVRQEAADIQTGLVINASDLNAEYNALQSAFDVTVGHTHDGTTGGGQAVTFRMPIGGSVNISTLSGSTFTQYYYINEAVVGLEGAINGAVTLGWPFPFSGTLSNLYLSTSGYAPGTTQTLTATVFVNGTSTTLTTNIAGAVAVSNSDTTHSAAVTAGQAVLLQVVGTAAMGAPYVNWGLQFSATNH